MLEYAAIAEQHSEYPRGEAIIRAERECGIALRPYSAVQVSPGNGIICPEQGQPVVAGTSALLAAEGIAATTADDDSNTEQTTVLVARTGEFLGRVTLADELRAALPWDALKKHGPSTQAVRPDGDLRNDIRAEGLICG